MFDVTVFQRSPIRVRRPYIIGVSGFLPSAIWIPSSDIFLGFASSSLFLPFPPSRNLAIFTRAATPALDMGSIHHFGDSSQ
jgi:hypothetical protein